MRTVFLDNDCRRDPKTRRFCIRCQKDIREDQPARQVHHFWDGGPVVAHPADDFVLPEGAEDYGWALIGLDCAKKIGIEFSVAEGMAPGGDV